MSRNGSSHVKPLPSFIDYHAKNGDTGHLIVTESVSFHALNDFFDSISLRFLFFSETLPLLSRPVVC